MIAFLKGEPFNKLLNLGPHKTSYLDFEDMDYICSYCSASF